MLTQQALQLISETILADLERGRPDWDLPHTKAVVHHVQELIAQAPELQLDEDVLVIAAYAHDWGYAGLFEQGAKADWDKVMAAKQQHMAIGAEKIAELLRRQEFEFLSEQQKQRIVHLVGNHDKLREIDETDELVLMEADTLGGLDGERVHPSFDKASGLRYLQGVRKARLPKFITEHGKARARELLQKAETHYRSL
jgi:hypothetical protein